MDQLAVKYITDHKNPVVKLNLAGSKLFLKSTEESDKVYVEQHLNNLEKVLSHDRVERRCARAQAIWNPDTNLAVVTKVVKNLVNTYGFQNKNGIFLYPEEMLYLLETNRMEVKVNDINLSIQDGYDIITKQPNNLNRYRVYKKLALQGYKLLNNEQYDKKRGKIKELHKSKECKRKSIELSESSSKKHKAEGPTMQMNETVDNYISNIFNKLRANAPKQNICNLEEKVDYYAFLPKNNSPNYDFRIFIREEKEFLTTEIVKHCDICAVFCGDNLSFYKLGNLVLPNL